MEDIEIKDDFIQEFRKRRNNEEQSQPKTICTQKDNTNKVVCVLETPEERAKHLKTLIDYSPDSKNKATPLQYCESNFTDLVSGLYNIGKLDKAESERLCNLFSNYKNLIIKALANSDSMVFLESV